VLRGISSVIAAFRVGPSDSLREEPIHTLDREWRGSLTSR